MIVQKTRIRHSRTKNIGGISKMGRKTRQQQNALVWTLGVVALLAVGFAAYSLSVAETTERPDGPAQEIGGVLYPFGVSPELYGKSATLSLAAFDRESRDTAQVNTTAYVWVQRWDSAKGEFEETKRYLGSATLLESSRVDFSGATTGDRVTLIAFNDDYPYGDVVSFTITRSSETENLNVYAGTSSVAITFYDEDGTVTTSVDIGSTPYAFEKIRIRNNESFTRFTPRLLGFDYAVDTNISSVQVSGLSKFDGTVDGLRGVDHWYTISEEALNNARINLDLGPVIVNPTGNEVSGETLTVYVLDLAPYITLDNQLAFGVRDDRIDGNDVGVADQSATITLV
jgi:hypothetical protein